MKKLNMFRYISFLSFLIIVAMQANAQENGNNIGITTTAVPFLRISPDARTGGMGDAGIAISPDANSGFYNLAKIPYAKNSSAIGATYTPWLREVADEMYLATLSGFHKLNEEEAVAASLRYFSAGNIALIDYNGNKLQTANPREFAFDAGYSRKLSDKFGLAAALRYIHSNLAKGTVNGTSYKAGNAVAADLSVYYNGLDDNRRGWTAGLSLANLGTKIGYTENTDQRDFLPASLGIGAAYSEAWDETNAITFAVDVNKLLVPAVPQSEEGMAAYRKKTVVGSWFNSFGNEAWQLGFGAEYGYNDLFYLRLGYNSKTYTYGNWQYITAGAGIRFNIATVNFSYLIPTGDKTSRNPLANTVRFGLLFGLN
jgi:hypothetical protein